MLLRRSLCHELVRGVIGSYRRGFRTSVDLSQSLDGPELWSVMSLVLEALVRCTLRVGWTIRSALCGVCGSGCSNNVGKGSCQQMSGTMTSLGTLHYPETQSGLYRVGYYHCCSYQVTVVTTSTAHCEPIDRAISIYAIPLASRRRFAGMT
jgi:hypothetical protein